MSSSHCSTSSTRHRPQNRSRVVNWVSFTGLTSERRTNWTAESCTKPVLLWVRQNTKPIGFKPIFLFILSRYNLGFPQISPKFPSLDQVIKFPYTHLPGLSLWFQGRIHTLSLYVFFFTDQFLNLHTSDDLRNVPKVDQVIFQVPRWAKLLSFTGAATTLQPFSIQFYPIIYTYIPVIFRWLVKMVVHLTKIDANFGKTQDKQQSSKWIGLT